MEAAGMPPMYDTYDNILDAREVFRKANKTPVANGVYHLEVPNSALEASPFGGVSDGIVLGKVNGKYVPYKFDMNKFSKSLPVTPEYKFEVSNFPLIERGY